LRASLALYLRALEVEPRLAHAAAQAAFTHLNMRINGFSQDPELDLREGARLAALAMELAPEASTSLSAQATVLRHQGRFAEALPLHERAAADPARVIDQANTGLTHLLLGDTEAAQPPPRAALERAPRHTFSPNWRGHLALALLLAGEADQAAEAFLTADRLYYVTEDRPFLRLAALLGAGRLAEAEALNAELRQQFPARTGPLRAALASNELRYRALFEAAVLAPLRGMGWFQAAQ
jgi:tetratricopeptide (TPR) repeat protein